MSFAFEALVGSLKMDVSDWQQKLPVAQRALSDFTQKAAADAAKLREQTGGMFSALTSGLTNAIPGLGQFSGALSQISGGAAMAAGTVATLAAVIGVKAVEAAAEAEQVAVRLDSVLKATGNTTGLTRFQMESLAEQIQETTQYEDEAALSAMTLLASMKEIRGDVFRDVTKTAADMAAVLGGDLVGASEMLGRALVAPEQAASRLMRAGIRLSDEQQKQIAGFMEVNDVASAQRVILDELANRYGGAAAKQAETLAGAWAQLKNEAGNLLEELGDSGLIYVVKGLTTAVKSGLGLFGMAVKAFHWLSEAIDSPYKKLLEIRIAWNEFWGDVEEAKALQAELDWLNDDTDRVNKNGGEAITPKPAEQVASGKAASGGTSTSSAASRSSRSVSAQREAAGPFDDIDARAQGARGWARLNAANLAQSTPDQSAEFVQQLKKELGAAITEDTLKSVWNWQTNTTDVDLSKFEKLLDVYQAPLERMPGFNRKIWDQVKADALRNLDQAARNHGEMRTFYLEATQDALGNAEAMFTDLKKKAEEAKREADDVAKAAKRAEEKAAKDRADVADETARAQAEQDKKNMAARKSAPDALSTMQGASKNELNKRLAEMRKQFQQAAGTGAAFGIGTPEQRRGLVAFSNQILDVMRAVRDSTGDARAANIEQLRQMQEAWAKAFQSIRDGSKETVEQLTADAAKQGEAGTKAAKQAADAASARTSPIADGINQVFAMGRELSGIFATSLSGVGAAQAGFQALAATITDPVEKLTLAIDAAKAQLGGMSINAGNFGGGWEMARTAQENILAMERERTALVRQQTIEREEAARLHEENYRRREQERQAAERDQRREQGLDIAGAVAVGKVPPVVLNINGVNDVRQAVDNLEKELLRRGLHKGGKRKFETK